MLECRQLLVEQFNCSKMPSMTQDHPQCTAFCLRLAEKKSCPPSYNSHVHPHLIILKKKKKKKERKKEKRHF